ncbi:MULTISPECIES: CRISPR-associated CARF protein Csa3 [unclassified Methanoculleus]|jgi:CRISPR-associated protein Csa3|uniref:CRISPR-associated CARF protein Csa3 n=1 Tax=unclassified Methanoculleus TaxID=2619537 RepID=UPI0025D2C1E5|nr:CRISPR-associated CARF protein Csa3 [Methanoculleus sp. UBA377]
MKMYVSPLGFDTSHVLALIVKYRIEAEDGITLLMSNKVDERSESAFRSLTEMIRAIDSRITVKKIQLDHSDFPSMVLACIEAINGPLHDRPGASIIVNLSGGPREILVALTIASVGSAPKIARVTSYSDVSRQHSEIDLPYLVPPLQDRELEVLQDIMHFGPTSIAGISSRLQISESSISRYCARLLSNRLIDLTERGKSKLAKARPSAGVVLSISQKP